MIVSHSQALGNLIMSKSRKTFKVEDLKTRINDFLLNSSDYMAESRTAQAMLLESILMETANYHGFSYLTQQQMTISENGTTIGINTYNSSEELKQMQKDKTLFKDTDHTRVKYC